MHPWCDACSTTICSVSHRVSVFINAHIFAAYKQEKHERWRKTDCEHTTASINVISYRGHNKKNDQICTIHSAIASLDYVPLQHASFPHLQQQITQAFAHQVSFHIHYHTRRSKPSHQHQDTHSVAPSPFRDPIPYHVRGLSLQQGTRQESSASGLQSSICGPLHIPYIIPSLERGIAKQSVFLTTLTWPKGRNQREYFPYTNDGQRGEFITWRTFHV